MSDEEKVFYPQEVENPEEETSLLPGFKSICVRLGVVVIITFAMRIVANVVATLIMIQPFYYDLGPVARQLISFALAAVFLNLIPIISAVFILKHPFKSAGKRVYEKPKYLGRALAMFPAGYGLAIAVSLLTVLIAGLLQGTAIGDSFNEVQESMLPTSMGAAVVQFVQAVLFAPIFEELWFRGLVMESLRPYGNGFAIFVSAALFGLTHGNFVQVFYATVIGIFLGYLAVSTGSIVTTTIVHAMFNAISSIMALLLSHPDVQEYVYAQGNGLDATVTPMVRVYTAWLTFQLLLMAVGVIMAIFKLVKIKRYKVPKVQTELSAPKRWGILCSRPAMIVAMVLILITYLEPIIVRVIGNIIGAE